MLALEEAFLVTIGAQAPEAKWVLLGKVSTVADAAMDRDQRHQIAVTCLLPSSLVEAGSRTALNQSDRRHGNLATNSALVPTQEFFENKIG